MSSILLTEQQVSLIGNHGSYTNDKLCNYEKAQELDCIANGVTIANNQLVWENSIVREYPAVDLGLPSGKLWCKYNLGAYTENDAEQASAFFSFGNVDPHYVGEDWQFTLAIYNASPGRGVNYDIYPYSGNDAASVLMGNGWRLPKKSDFLELSNYTTREWVIADGKYGGNGLGNGVLLHGTNGNTNTLFIPLCGDYGENGWNMKQSGHTFYAAIDYKNYQERYGLGLQFFNKDGLFAPGGSNTKYVGAVIRAIKDPNNMPS